MHTYGKVRFNKRTRGVDGMNLEELDKDYKNHLYKPWNQMSSGSYISPPVRLVETPKKKGWGDFNVSFDFLGYAFKPRLAQNGQRGEWFASWVSAVGTKSKKSMSDKLP